MIEITCHVARHCHAADTPLPDFETPSKAWQVAVQHGTAVQIVGGDHRQRDQKVPPPVIPLGATLRRPALARVVRVLRKTRVVSA